MVRKSLQEEKRVNTNISWIETVILTDVNEEKKNQYLKIKGQKGYFLVLI